MAGVARALGARSEELARFPLAARGGDARCPARQASAAVRAARLRSLIAMRITAIEAVPLAIPLRPMTPASSWTGGTRKQIFVRVHTDEGVSGLGEAFAYGAPLAVVSVIEESLAPLVVGQDPLRIEAVVDLMHRGTMIYGRRGLGMFAISGIEIALWDLLGKVRGAPVYELLGGAQRTRLPAYASLLRYESPEAVAAACRHYVAQGFRMLKLHRSTWARYARRARRWDPTWS